MMKKIIPFLPRIIGLISIIIGVLYFNQVFGQSVVLILIGAVLLFSKQKTLDFGTDKFAESLKFGKSYLLALMYDVLFLVGLIVITVVFDKVMGWTASQLVLNKDSVAGMQASISSIVSFLIKGPIALLVFLILFVLIFFFIFGVYSITKNKGYRVISIFLFVVNVYFALFVSACASMSISGVWL